MIVGKIGNGLEGGLNCLLITDPAVLWTLALFTIFYLSPCVWKRSELKTLLFSDNDVTVTTFVLRLTFKYIIGRTPTEFHNRIVTNSPLKEELPYNCRHLGKIRTYRFHSHVGLFQLLRSPDGEQGKDGEGVIFVVRRVMRNEEIHQSSSLFPTTSMK